MMIGLVLLLGGAAAALETTPGWRVRSVVTASHGVEDGALHLVHRHRLRDDGSRRLLALPSLDDAGHSRASVLALLKLAVAAYPGPIAGEPYGVDFAWSADTLDDVVAGGDQLFAASPATSREDNVAQQAFHDAIVAEVGANATTAFRAVPATTAIWDTGVVALEWTRGDVHVLAFRGSYTGGDFGNIENWFLDTVLETSTAKLKHAWKTDAGLAWGDDQKDRAALGDLGARTLFNAQRFYLDGGPSHEAFSEDLADAVATDPSLDFVGLDEKKAKRRGYWPLTKVLVDAVVDALPSGATLLLTGHSQGATRAALASMSAAPAFFFLFISSSRGP